MPTSLRSRVRLLAFVAVLIAMAGVAIGPLRALLAREHASSGDILLVSALVLIAVVFLVVSSQIVARWLADLTVNDLETLLKDVRRTVTAEAHGRRGAQFLEARSESFEVGRLRDEMRLLLATLQARGMADRAVLGATVHDLKAGLSGLAHLLDSESRRLPDAAGTTDHRLAAAGAEAKRLMEALSVMMTYLRNGQRSIESPGQIELGEIAQRAVAQVRVDRPGVEVTVRAVGSAHVRGDPMLLTQAIENLVANAVRAARSSVAVTVYPGVVRIEDDGPGLAGDLSALVAPFASGRLDDGDRAVAAGSLGLGLYIAHRVLESHEGGLGVERSDARGTVLLAYVGRSAT